MSAATSSPTTAETGNHHQIRNLFLDAPLRRKMTSAEVKRMRKTLANVGSSVYGVKTSRIEEQCNSKCACEEPAACAYSQQQPRRLHVVSAIIARKILRASMAVYLAWFQLAATAQAEYAKRQALGIMKHNQPLLQPVPVVILCFLRCDDMAHSLDLIDSRFAAPTQTKRRGIS